MIKYLSALLLALFVATSAESAVSTSGLDEAIQSANTWLSLTDAGNYDEGYKQASALFKISATASDWEKFSQLRNLFGASASRKLLSSNAVTTLSGMPDGEYMVLCFKAEYANKKEANETLSLTKEEDGVWRIVGYQVK